MKYLITESKLDSFIYNYLSQNFHPDYNWGPDLHNFYKKDVEKYGFLEFEINDRAAYVYYLDPYLNDRYKPKTIFIYSWLSDDLDKFFGSLWKPVFIKWFKDGSGLDIEHMVEEKNFSLE